MTLRLFGLMAFEACRALMRALLASIFFRWYYRGTRSAKLGIAPQDLRTADPTVAAEIYAGRFAFSGKLAVAGGRSPFELHPPSLEWAKSLYGFGWLRHLRAADSALARTNARALVEEWIDLHGGWQKLAFDPEITARRVMAWLAQSPVVLENADFTFYRKFVASLTRQVHYLSFVRRFMRDDMGKLQTAVALAQAGLCFNIPKLQRRAKRWLERELTRQILADGGHISRNPGAILQILLDLLPLRHSYIALSLMPPQALISSIDRMMPMVRFFRHNDGAFALFNGMGPTPADIVATLLAYDDTRGIPPAFAPASGYRRLHVKDVLLFMDTGAPPPLRFSQTAHAGALSFEFSDGADRLVVNCGMPWAKRASFQPAARWTVAHSTLSVDSRSQASFPSSTMVRRLLGPVMTGNLRVISATENNSIQSEIHASQDGYAHSFGVRHERQLALTTDGNELAGVDDLMPAQHHGAKDAPFILRFHLHPAVRASQLREGEAVLLLLPSGRAWKFYAPGFKASIEDSLYLGGADGARHTKQIVIYGNVRETPRVRWHFTRYQGATDSDDRDNADDPSLLL